MTTYCYKQFIKVKKKKFLEVNFNLLIILLNGYDILKDKGYKIEGSYRIMIYDIYDVTVKLLVNLYNSVAAEQIQKK